VTPDFFRVLRVGPSLGIGFASDQDHPGRDHVAVIGDGLWRSRFGADESVLNRSITLNGTQYTVIGVMPAGFSYPSKTDLWVPLAVRADPHLTYSRPVIGRLAPGVSREQAGATFEVFASNVLRDRGGAPDQIARVIALKDAMVGDVKQPLAIFSGAVICVLLIACANVANLLLMRATTRRQEIATRMALGASRGRLVRQLLTESAALSIAGGLAALGVAAVTAPVLLTLVPEGMLPRASEIRADGWVLAVTMTGALIAGVLLGLAPALQATRGDVSNALREGPGSSTKRSLRFRHGLIVAEMALALVLLVGAGLLVKSFLKLRAVDPGFESSHVMTMTIELPDTRYASPAALKAFHQRLLESLSSLPDVTSAGLVNWIPLGTLVLRGDFEVEGLPAPGWNVMKAAVSAGYFRALGIRLLQGRDFTAEDSAGSQRVVIVNDSMARRIWPDGNAVGRRIAIDSPAKPDDWLTVIGVVADVRQGGLAHRAPPALYQPYEQVTHQFWLSHMTFVVRTTGDPASSAPRMRTALQTIDNEQAPHALATMEDLVAGTIAEPRFQSRLLGLFSLLALVLAGLGVYGVLASSVAERRREIGIRLALGAGRASVAGLIMRRTLTLASIGVVLGTIGGLAVTRVLAKLLFGVTPTDLTTFLGAASVLVAVAVASSLIPARHASTVDPLISLKAE
jgi:putative ABC transport system permease protein